MRDRFGLGPFSTGGLVQTDCIQHCYEEEGVESGGGDGELHSISHCFTLTPVEQMNRLLGSVFRAI